MAPEPPSEEGAAAQRGTTTISTIAVRAGENATIVIALLKSDGHISLRIDEMTPRLLAIGGSVEETGSLLHIHEDVVARLRDKEDQVQALLSRADALGSEKKDPNEAIVYDAMAASLNQAWRELSRQLLLRGYLLKETLSFYRMALHHEQLTTAVADGLRRALASEGSESQEVVRRIEQVINEVIDTTAAAVDAGSSVISQIRALGQVDDNPETAQEILQACVMIENVMLRIASEWERVEQTWKGEKGKIGIQQDQTETVEETFVQIEEWLKLAERKVKALNETGIRRLMEEGNEHKTRLPELGAAGSADGGRVAHLSGRIEEFLHYVKTRMGRSQRIQAFFHSAASMLSQLSLMESDLRSASAAMVGELVPLARQKASSVIYEGRDIAAKEVLSHEEQRLVKQKCEEMEERLARLEQVATERTEAAKQLRPEVQSLRDWMFTRGEPFLAQNAEMGSSLPDASQFLARHKEFANEVVNRDSTVMSVLSHREEMTQKEQETVVEFERQYEKLKDTLENRIQLGSSYEQVHKFARDLDSSFDALTSLLDTNRDFTNERVAAQMDNVFHMIEQTIEQQRHQGEKFISSAEQVGRSDCQLNVNRAIEKTRNIVTDHDHRFTYVTAKWREWQINKTELKRLVTIVEEVQMWQEEAIEIIRLLQNTKASNRQENESIQRRVEEFRQTMDQQKRKLSEATTTTQNEELTKKVSLVTERQRVIEDLVQQLQNKIETVNETFLQEEVHERIQAPQILTTLRDAQVDEGSRFEFAARIEGEPEPTISWLKDGIDVKSSMDYRQDFVNGLASLVIEETFIEDTATYTVRAANAGGVAESSAKLVVKSRSALSSLVEEDKPRFAKPLRNVAVSEGETAKMDCVIVGRPEPQVIWYKEESTVKEDERVRLEFEGDHCSLTIDRVEVPDTGLYTAKAKNTHGETTSFCQLKVAPKKVAPPPPPKPASRPPSVLQRPPSIQPALTNTTWTEGQTATLQVFTQGEPRPHVEWRKDNQLVVNTHDVTIQEQADGWSRLIISPVAPSHAGMYTVVAENEAGEATTGASLHVQQAVTTTEDMYQQDMYEQISTRPVQTTTETTNRSSYEERELRSAASTIPFHEQVDHELSSIQSERRWVDIIDEQLSQPSPITSPIPQPVETKKKTTTTEQRWVDEIDEMLGYPKQEVKREEREVRTAETYVKMVDDLMRQTVPQAVHEAATTTTHTEYAQQIHEAPQPDRRQASMTPSSKMFNQATVRQSPQPEVYSATTTTTQAKEHAAISRKTPVPEAHTATMTHASSVENIAAIRHTPVPEAHTAYTTQPTAVESAATVRQTPVPEAHTATMTKAVSVENIAAIRQTPVPEAHTATTTQTNVITSAATIRQTPVPEAHQASISSSVHAVENIASIQQPAQPVAHTATTTESTIKVSSIGQVHAPGPQPDKQAIIKEKTQVERIDDIVLQQIPRHSTGDVRQTITTEGFVTHSDQHFDQPTVTTTVKTTVQEEAITDRALMDRQDSLNTVTVIHKKEEDLARSRIQQVPESPRPQRKFVPQTTTTTTHSGEGWVQEVHDEMGKPTTTVVRKYTEEESGDTRGERRTTVPDSYSSVTVVRETTEDASKQRQETKIPVRREPVTTTKVTGEGWVQEIHDEVGKPTTTTIRRYTDEEMEQINKLSKREQTIPIQRQPVTTTTVSGEGWVQEVHDEIGKPSSTTVRKYTDEELTGIKKQLTKESTIPIKRQQPVTTTTVSGEGWVQEIHDEMGKPTTTTVRRYTDQEMEDINKRSVYGPGQTNVNIVRETTEDAQLRKQQTSKIPIRREPVTTTTVSGEGCVQEIHDEMGKPTTTTVRKYTDEEMNMMNNQHIVNIRPTTTVDRSVTDEGYAHSEVSRGPRDSYILASDAEGFWTDGAYTASPTPPPVPRHRDEFCRELGESRTSTEPEFFRPFDKDYTVDEGESLKIECLLVGNPRPKVRFYFNDQLLRTDTEFCKVSVVNDTYSLTINSARLEHAGYYKIAAENKRGYTESLTVVHVRPRSLKAAKNAKPTEHTTVTTEFAMFEYEQRRPQKHEGSKLATPPPAKRLHQTHKRDEEHLEQYDLDERRAAGHPPHFTQTLVSAVAADGESARFEGIVTGWPAPSVEWTKDGQLLSAAALPSIQTSNIGGRVSLSFELCCLQHSGKYMCTAKNSSGVATSSAQLVVRPKTIAPDFIQRLISEEIAEGRQLRWTVKVTGDPKPKITWLRDGILVPDCEEVRLIDAGNGEHSLLIVRVEAADSGQFTCLAENSAGEARSTADLVVRPEGTEPGNYFHVTKVTQEKQVKGEDPVRNSAFTIENPRQSAML